MTAPNICELVGRDKHHLVQLCLPIEHVNGKLKFPMLASEKLDGVFCLAVVLDGKCYIYSRTGEEYLSLNHLKGGFCYLARISQLEVFIFEAYAPGVPQPTISGFCRDTKGQHISIDAYIHDAMTLKDFVTCDTDGYYSRYVYLQACMKQRFSYLHLIPQKEVYSLEHLQKYADYMIEKGCEGVVAREEFSSYQAGKRNKSMIKVKKGVSFDLKVVALEEGEGKYKCHCGKLVCEDSKGIKVRVGSGLTDEQRKLWWSAHGSSEILGKIVQIDAMAVSTKGVLREPRFKGIRTDKVEVDTIC